MIDLELKIFMENYIEQLKKNNNDKLQKLLKNNDITYLLDYIENNFKVVKVDINDPSFSWKLDLIRKSLYSSYVNSFYKIKLDGFKFTIYRIDIDDISESYYEPSRFTISNNTSVILSDELIKKLRRKIEIVIEHNLRYIMVDTSDKLLEELYFKLGINDYEYENNIFEAHLNFLNK